MPHKVNVCTYDCFTCPFPDCKYEYHKGDIKVPRELYGLTGKHSENMQSDEESKRKRKFRVKQNITIYSDFGKRLKKARIAHGMTMRQLGNFMCVSNSSIWEWETGRRPAPEQLLRLIFPELDERDENNDF